VEGANARGNFLTKGGGQVTTGIVRVEIRFTDQKKQEGTGETEKGKFGHVSPRGVGKGITPRGKKEN